MKGASTPRRNYGTAGFLGYVEQASEVSLGNVQLSRLAEAANIRGRIAGEIEDWVRAQAEALVAGWMLEQEKSQGAGTGLEGAAG